MKALLWVLGGVGALLVVLALSVMLHLPTENGRRALADLMGAQASAESRGTLTVEAIDEVGFDRLVMRGYRITAPNGEKVIDAERIVGDPVVMDLFSGRIHLVDARFERATVWLTPGPGGQINLVWASEVPDDRNETPVIIEGIRLVDNTIVVDLPGKPRMRMTGISGLAHLEVGHHYLWRLDRTSGTAHLPVVGATPFTNMHGRLKSDHAHPLLVEMAVDLSIAEPVANLDYHVPAIAGEDGEPSLDLDLPDGIFAGGDRDADDADDGGPAPGGTRDDTDDDIDEDTDEDIDERADEDADVDEDMDEDVDERADESD